MKLLLRHTFLFNSDYKWNGLWTTFHQSIDFLYYFYKIRFIIILLKNNKFQDWEMNKFIFGKFNFFLFIKSIYIYYTYKIIEWGTEDKWIFNQ